MSLEPTDVTFYGVNTDYGVNIDMQLDVTRCSASLVRIGIRELTTQANRVSIILPIRVAQRLSEILAVMGRR